VRVLNALGWVWKMHGLMLESSSWEDICGMCLEVMYDVWTWETCIYEMR